MVRFPHFLVICYGLTRFLVSLISCINFEYYWFWPDGSKKQTHSRISVSIATQAVITPRSALLLYFEFDLVLDNYYFAFMGINYL